MLLDQKEEVLDRDDDLDNDIETLGWYSLRVMRDEKRCVDQIMEHIAVNNLQSKIVEVKYLKEYAIVESEEYSPNSEFLPKRGFKNTDKSIWVWLPNGNYKRIRVTTKKPLSGMIFIKMQFDLDLFKMIRSWDAGYSFLGFPHPLPISENQLNKTCASLNDEFPNLEEYAAQKGYRVMDNNKSFVSKPKPVPDKVEKVVEKQEEPTEELLEDAFTPVKELSPEEEKDAQKARIYSELNIKEDLDSTFASENVKAAPAKGVVFSVNNFVLIKHLGFKGVIQEIDYEQDKVVVGVQMFGRRQPVECQIKDIQLI